MKLDWIARVTDALLTGLTTVAVLGCALLAAGGRVPDWLLPAGLIAAVPFARRLTSARVETKRERWQLLLLGALLAAAAGALAYGAVATTSRHWDGAVAWDLKAALLTAEPTLRQPAFADPAALHHSRDYPLLQPLLMALLERLTGVGRLFLPLVWLLACAALFVAAVRRGVAVVGAAATAVAFALTPTLVRTTGGSVDSGYAEVTLAAWVTVTAAGCIGRDRRWIALGVLSMLLSKPEGLPYAAALLAVAWLRPRWQALLPTAIGLGLGAAVLIPLQHTLTWAERRPLPAMAWVVALAPSLLAVASDAALRRAGRDALRPWLAAGAVVVTAVGLPALVTWTGSEGSSLARLLRDLTPLWQRLDRLPAMALALLDYALLRGWFGLTVPVLLFVVLRALRRRDGREDLPAVLWLLLLLPIWSVSFLISDKDLDLHLRSRLPRLMLHVTGLAWACVLPALAGPRPPAAEARDPTAPAP